jgi:drug/metabolite transporter (DMT)-like permease
MVAVGLGAAILKESLAAQMLAAMVITLFGVAMVHRC